MRAIGLHHIVGVVGAAILLGITAPAAAGRDARHLLTDMYYMFDFVPKYRQADCRIVIQFRFKEGAWIDPWTAIYESFFLYPGEGRPKTLLDMQGVASDGPFEVWVLHFIDKCDKKTEITDAVIAKIRSDYPEIIISRMDSPPARYRESHGGSAFIDSNDYDKEYWALKQAAVTTCDPVKWIALARYSQKSGENVGGLLSLFLARRLRQRQGLPDITANERKVLLDELLPYVKKMTAEEYIKTIDELVSEYLKRPDCNR